MSPIEEVYRHKVDDAAAAAQWFGAPRQAAQPATDMQEGDFDVEFGPPGLPMLLAEAQGVSPTPTDDIDTFDATDDLLLISNKMMQIPKFNDLLTPGDPIRLASEAISLVPLEHASHRGIFQPPIQPPAPQSQFMPRQPGNYNEYTGQYENRPKEPSYTNQASY